MTEKLYIVIETFPESALYTIYERLHTKGRGLPEGLEFVESWLDAAGNRVFQVMRTDDPALFEKWQKHWDDLIDFEIVELRDKPRPKP